MVKSCVWCGFEIKSMAKTKRRIRFHGGCKAEWREYNRIIDSIVADIENIKDVPNQVLFTVAHIYGIEVVE